MKTKLLLSVLLSLNFCLLSSQVPQGFNYQAVARNTTTGKPIINTILPVRITIQSDSLGGTAFWIEEHPYVTTNDFGLFTLILGQGVKQIGSTVSTFNDIYWTVTPKFIKIEINYNGWNTMGSSRLWTVPYSMVAGDLGGAVKKLAVAGEDIQSDEALFEVKRKDGQTMFAVYNQGVRVFMPLDTLSKARKGGFAIGGFSKTKGTTTIQDYFVVGPDSIRAYIAPGTGKGTKGGFAIGGFDPTKTTNREEYLRVTRDSTRVYINDKTKGTKGGFAIGGFSTTKGGNASFLNVATDASGIINPSQNKVLWYPLKNAFLTGKVLIEKPDSVGENSFATGYESKAIGQYSQAMGYKSVARGDNSTAIGNYSVAVKMNSFAAGYNALASGQDAYAIGTGTEASGEGSFAIGFIGQDSAGIATGNTKASAPWALAMGMGSQATAQGAVAIGTKNKASGIYSLALGYGTKAINDFAFAFGLGTSANGHTSTAMGNGSQANGNNSFALGYGSFANGDNSVAMGNTTQASGDHSTSMGSGSIASGIVSTTMGSTTRATDFCSTAMGSSTTASGVASTSMGESSTASGGASTAMGSYTFASGQFSTAMGRETVANEFISTAMGWGSKASGNTSTAMGNMTIASGGNSTAMGRNSTASGGASTSMGLETRASGDNSTAMGYSTKAEGHFSTAMGSSTSANGRASASMGESSVAFGSSSFALGSLTTANGTNSVASGFSTIASGEESFTIGHGTISKPFALLAIGQFNDTTVSFSNSAWDLRDQVFVIGNGSSHDSRSNAFTVLKSGNTAIGHAFPTQMLDVNGNARFRGVTSGTYSAELNLTSDGTLTTSTSDISMKTDIIPLQDAVIKILAMRGVYFSWKNDSMHNRRIGFIAQEMEKVLPEVVFTNPVDGLKGINYSEITAILAQAVKEQQQQIENQRKEIDELKSLVNNIIANQPVQSNK